MRPYTVLFRPGPTWVVGAGLGAQDLEAHGRYHQQLFEAGTVLFAGPFIDDAPPSGDAVVGLVVLQAASPAEARALCDADPAVVTGVFTAELRAQHLVFNRYIGKGLTDPGPGI